jgi:protein phosphatase
MLVADGMGGHAGGEVASRNALLSTIQFITRSPKWALKLDDPATREHEIEELFVRGRGYLSRVHEVLRQQAAKDPNLAEMGTTLTGAYSLGTDLFVLHIGDSKAFLLRDGALTRFTRDHTVAQEYADLGVIRQDEVPGHKLSHVLTRAIGGPADDVAGDMQMRTVCDKDRLLLCSDGLTDMADDAEIAAVMRAHPASADACRALVDLALERGGRDNVTVIVAGYSIA